MIDSEEKAAILEFIAGQYGITFQVAYSEVAQLHKTPWPKTGAEDVEGCRLGVHGRGTTHG